MWQHPCLPDIPHLPLRGGHCEGCGGSLLVRDLPRRPFPRIQNSLHWHMDPLPLPASRTRSPWSRDPLPWLLLVQRHPNPALESCGTTEAGNPLLSDGLEKWNYIPES